MDQRMVYVGLDVHKETIAVAVTRREAPAPRSTSARSPTVPSRSRG